MGPPTAEQSELFIFLAKEQNPDQYEIQRKTSILLKYVVWITKRRSTSSGAALNKKKV